MTQIANVMEQEKKGRSENPIHQMRVVQDNILDGQKEKMKQLEKNDKASNCINQKADVDHDAVTSKDMKLTQTIRSKSDTTAAPAELVQAVDSVTTITVETNDGGATTQTSSSASTTATIEEPALTETATTTASESDSSLLNTKETADAVHMELESTGICQDTPPFQDNEHNSAMNEVNYGQNIQSSLKKLQLENSVLKDENVRRLVHVVLMMI